MAILKGEVRRGQVITTYGVGSIVAVEDESFVVKGIDQWNVSNPDLHEPRLERELQVVGFARPPASDKGPDVPVSRFPRWYSCPSCRLLDEHRNFASFAGNTCNRCDVPLIPSRFVIACRRGHLDDFPYERWVHGGSPSKDKSHTLYIETGGLTASLKSIVIKCECGRAVDMDGAFERTAMQGVTRCWGKRPWLTAADGECDEMPRTLQRGASNVWFSATRSALSIPPWSEAAFKLLNAQWAVVKAIPDDALKPTLSALHLDETSGFSLDDLVEAVRMRRRNEQAGDPVGHDSLRAQEYEALIKGAPDSPLNPDFVCVPGQVGPVADRGFERVMLVKRLREVRALQYFTRLLPPTGADPPEHRVPIYVDNPGWLPAIEVTGEGVFLTLDRKRIDAWETDPVRQRAERVNLRYRELFKNSGHSPDREITPRLLLVHTIAHVLINQWALESGYPAASLRERLFVSDESAGLLIYTATSDSAGSLGGVVAQAEPDRLEAAVSEAISRAAWCSSDPICIEAQASGVDSLNLAACHACVLLPEVSCEERNLLLDRGVLIGTPDKPELGFFADRHAEV